MAGLSALNSKLKTLQGVTVQVIKGRNVSVVYMNEDGTIDWPDNANPEGVLLVPKPCNEDEWESMAKAYKPIRNEYSKPENPDCEGKKRGC